MRIKIRITIKIEVKIKTKIKIKKNEVIYLKKIEIMVQQ